jgi:hypothetical protein
MLNGYALKITPGTLPILTVLGKVPPPYHTWSNENGCNYRVTPITILGKAQNQPPTRQRNYASRSRGYLRSDEVRVPGRTVHFTLYGQREAAVLLAKKR